MTLAYDTRTGALLGQVCRDPAPGVPHPPSGERLTLLTRTGHITVRRSFVRLETTR